MASYQAHGPLFVKNQIKCDKILYASDGCGLDIGGIWYRLYEERGKGGMKKLD